MSMYDEIFQPSQKRAELLLGMLGFNSLGDVGRYRDSWVEKTENGDIRIAMYTRNGGGNRYHYSNDDDGPAEGADCDCTGCIITHGLPHHELYLFDRDDEFDSTYATVYFRLPQKILDDDDLMATFAEVAREPVNMSDLWLEAIDQIGSAS